MSSDNKLDKTGLAYLWSKMTAYVQEIVGYVPELFIQIGNTPLGTTAATISGAIREIGDRVGNTVMGTTAATVTGAVKELVDKIGNAEMGTEAVTITGAIAEHEQDIGSLKSKIVTKIADDYLGADTSGTVKTYNLEGEATYIMLIGKINASGSGFYLIVANAINTMIGALQSSSVATVTSSGTTMTVTTSANYIRITIVKIGG